MSVIATSESFHKGPRLIRLDDTLWNQLRDEAEIALAQERALAPLFVNFILNRSSFEEAVAHRVAARLGNEAMSAYLIADMFRQALVEDPAIGLAFRSDLLAVFDRDPASTRLLEPFLHFKGFHALEAHRLAHWLWTRQRTDFALYLQSRSSDVFQTDINPAAQFGKGIFLDHGTGLVVGATSVIEDDVSILQNVTLGGTGKETGDRHPKVRRGAMIGAGAKILGNIEIGTCSRIAAGSVVLQPVPPRTTMAGVPARPVDSAGTDQPAHSMDQILSQLAYDSFTYII